MKKLLILIALLTSAIVCKAQDYAYEWRGVMIDVSRHFLPIEYLYKEVDAMSHFGLNRLHIHLTDAAGWRIEIKSRPRLTDIGAWRTHKLLDEWWNGDRKYSDCNNGFGGYYTQDEMRKLVAYANSKGVDIIPEIEFPAHSEEVIAAYPEVGFNHAEMDMKKEDTYTFMRDVLTELTGIFTSEYIHVGGDEAATQNGLQPEGMRRVKQIVDSLGRKMIAWDETLTEEPSDSDIIIMVWRNIEIANKAVSLGHDVILCPGRYCYFDKSQDAPMSQPESMGGYLPIDSVFMMPATIEKKYEHHILGVQGNVWTEHIPTPQHLEYMLWPRALAIAEIGRLGLNEKRDVKAFHKWAVDADTYLIDSLHINAFDLRKEIGQRKQTFSKKPLPYSLTYNKQPHSAYPGSGGNTLKDNKIGGWSNNDGSWQGFITNMDITLDLGKVRTIHSILGDFMQCVNPDIFFPYQIIISTSLDGKNFTTLHDLTYPEIYATQKEDYRSLGWEGKTRTRFIRLQCIQGERRGWIFCSEITVK